MLSNTPRWYAHLLGAAAVGGLALVLVVAIADPFLGNPGTGLLGLLVGVGVARTIAPPGVG